MSNYRIAISCKSTGRVGLCVSFTVKYVFWWSGNCQYLNRSETQTKRWISFKTKDWKTESIKSLYFVWIRPSQFQLSYGWSVHPFYVVLLNGVTWDAEDCPKSHQERAIHPGKVTNLAEGTRTNWHLGVIERFQSNAHVVGCGRKLGFLDKPIEAVRHLGGPYLHSCQSDMNEILHT